MKKILLIGGFALCTIAGIMTSNDILNYKIYQSRNVVIVKVIKVSNCNNRTYKNKFLTVQYKEHKTVLRTSCKYLKNLRAGQQIEMFHKEGTTNFVFPNQDIVLELISDLLIGFAGLVFMGLPFRNNMAK